MRLDSKIKKMMFRRFASISLFAGLLALCAASNASAGFDWTAVANKGAMQTGDVSSRFFWCRRERERER